MPTMDQVVWQSVNLATGEGEATQYKRGELLPATEDQEQLAQRSLLRIGGALRVVEVVYTEEELAEQARSRGQASARAAVAHDVDPDATMGAQVPGTAEPGLPTLTATHGGAVVIGDEDLRATHEQQAADAAAAAEEKASAAPASNASKSAWAEYAVRQGMPEDEAHGMSRDALAARFRAGE